MSELIAIGASSGGLDAINQIFSLMPPRFPIPVVVVLHFPRTASVNLSSIFDVPQGISLNEAHDKMSVEPSNVYLAPPGYHLLIEKNRSFSLSQDEPVNFSIPSIDVLFESAASVYKGELTGVLLTGASADGANGLLEIQKHGGRTFVQEPCTAAMPTMPQSALDVMKPDAVLTLSEIARRLFKPEPQEESAWKN